MENYEEIRLLVENLYDHQLARQRATNRVRTIVRNRLEKSDFRETDKKKSNKEKAYGEEWNDKKVKDKLEQAKKEGKLAQDDYDYLNDLLEFKKKGTEFEKYYHKQIMKLVKDEKIFKNYLVDIKGVAELSAANLIGYLGYCEGFDTISKLWRYCGLAVMDGQAERKRRGEHIHYNPRLKTFMYKISDCFVKQGDGYRKIYDKFKKKYQKAHPKEIDNPGYLETKKGFKKMYTKMHIDLMARRKVEKIFLANYWLTARKMKKLDTRSPYVIDKQDHKTLIKPFTDAN